MMNVIECLTDLDNLESAITVEEAEEFLNAHEVLIPRQYLIALCELLNITTFSHDQLYDIMEAFIRQPNYEFFFNLLPWFSSYESYLILQTLGLSLTQSEAGELFSLLKNEEVDKIDAETLEELARELLSLKK